MQQTEFGMMDEHIRLIPEKITLSEF